MQTGIRFMTSEKSATWRGYKPVLEDEALTITLPLYGAQKKSCERRVIRDGGIHGIARVLQEINRTSLAEKMEQYENRRLVN
jgi:hypothetical protein